MDTNTLMRAIVAVSHSNIEFSIHGEDKYENIRWLNSNIEIPTKEIVMRKKQELDDELPMMKLRKLRDALLVESDKYMLPDFPITEEQKNEILTYRQELRDFPASGKTDLPINPMN